MLICILKKFLLFIILNNLVLFSGGTFPLPPAAAQLCTILPPPGCFRGPFVAVDLLMDVFSRIQLPEHGKWHQYKVKLPILKNNTVKLIISTKVLIKLNFNVYVMKQLFNFSTTAYSR